LPIPKRPNLFQKGQILINEKGQIFQKIPIEHFIKIKFFSDVSKTYFLRH